MHGPMNIKIIDAKQANEMRLVHLVGIIDQNIITMHGPMNIKFRCNSFTSLLLDVYVSLNMFRAPPRPSSGAYNCISSLWFYRWSVGGSSAVGRGLADHDQQHCYHQRSNGKTRGCCSCKLLMMGVEAPETC